MLSVNLRRQHEATDVQTGASHGHLLR
jgi:hypothetical protein